MALIVLALLLVVRASETDSSAWLLAGAAALGLAFDVKLLESLVALPGLALLAYLGLPGPRRRRLLQLSAASAVYVVGRAVVAGSDAAWSPPTTAPTRSARPTAAPGTPRSCSTAPTACRASRSNPRPSTSRASTIRWRPSPSATTSRSSRRRPRACSHASGRSRASGWGSSCSIALLLGLPAFICTLLATGGRGRASESRRPAPQGRRTGRVDADRHRTVQRHGATAPTIRGGIHAGRGRDARDRGVAWGRPTDRGVHPRAPARAEREPWRYGPTYVERLLYGRPDVWWITLVRSARRRSRSPGSHAWRANPIDPLSRTLLSAVRRSR